MWYKKTVRRASTGAGLTRQGCADNGLNIPSCSSYEALWRQDGARCRSRIWELTRQGIQFTILGPWSVGQTKVKTGEKQRPETRESVKRVINGVNANQF